MFSCRLDGQNANLDGKTLQAPGSRQWGQLSARSRPHPCRRGDHGECAKQSKWPVKAAEDLGVILPGMTTCLLHPLDEAMQRSNEAKARSHQ